MARTQRGWRDRKVYVSAMAKETAYGTALGTPVDTAFRVNSAPFRQEKVRTPDTDLIGGTEEAGAFDELSNIVRGTLSMPRVTPHFLAFLASYALGSVVTTIPEATKTARLHEIKPKTTDYLLDSFTVEEVLAAGVQKQYTGCMIDSLTLRVTNGGWWEASADIIGRGSVDAGAASPAAVSEAFTGARDSKVWFSTGAYDGSLSQDKTTSDLASATAVEGIIREAEWTLRNNIPVDELREFNAGLNLARAERDRRDQSFRATFEYRDDDAWLGHFLNQDLLSFEIETHGNVLAGDATMFFYGHNILFPKLQIADYDFPEAVGKSLIAVNFDVLQDTALGSVVLGVLNAQTGYLQ